MAAPLWWQLTHTFCIIGHIGLLIASGLTFVFGSMFSIMPGDFPSNIPRGLPPSMPNGFPSTMPGSFSPSVHDRLRASLNDRLHSSMQENLRSSMQESLHSSMHDSLRSGMQDGFALKVIPWAGFAVAGLAVSINFKLFIRLSNLQRRDRDETVGSRYEKKIMTTIYAVLLNLLALAADIVLAIKFGGVAARTHNPSGPWFWHGAFAMAVLAAVMAFCTVVADTSLLLRDRRRKNEFNEQLDEQLDDQSLPEEEDMGLGIRL